MDIDKEGQHKHLGIRPGEAPPLMPRLSRLYEGAARPLLELSPEDSLIQMSELIRLYSFAIPTQEALRKIAAYQTSNKITEVVEIGAGGGYWARSLREFGVSVRAYDLNPRSPEKSWFIVDQGGHERAGTNPEATLMLCCPEGDLPGNSPASLMAYKSLETYKNAGGTRLIFIGWHAPPGGRFAASASNTGDSLFHAELAQNWKLVDGCALPNWPRWKNSLHIFERRA